MWSLVQWWRWRKHDRSDINCVAAREPWSLTGNCEPCRVDGGYVARSWAEQDVRREAGRG